MVFFRATFLELFTPFGITAVLMTALLMLEKVYRLVNLMVEERLRVREVALLLGYLTPEVLAITLPLAVVGAVFATVIRQSGDLELVALRATGKSLWGYAIPFVCFAVLMTLLTAAVTLWVQPVAWRKYNDLQVEMVRWRAEQKLVPGELSFDFGDKVIRIGGRADENLLTDIFISNREQGPRSSVIAADTGRIAVDETRKQVVFRLDNGVVYTPDETGEVFNTIDFRELSYVLEYEPVADVNVSRKTTLTNSEVIAGIREIDPERRTWRALVVELNERLIIPLSCLALGIGALPLAVVDPRSGRSAGYLRGLVLVLVYYILWAGVRDAAQEGLAGWPVLWLPVVAVLGYGLWRVWQLNTDAAPPALATLRTLLGRR